MESAALSLGITQNKSYRCFVSGKDVFVCLPAGFGKTGVCYIVLPVVFDTLRKKGDW